MPKLTLILSILMAMVMSSCGDLRMDKIKKAAISQFAVCEMDMERFNKFFVENIDEQMFCLEENLNLFINILFTIIQSTTTSSELCLKPYSLFRQYIDHRIDDMIHINFSLY